MIQLENIGDDWDVIVVGGGPAGSAAAISAAKLGLRVLQVDAKAFPRRKVCGGCLNVVSVGLLEQLVGESTSILADAQPLTRFRLMDRRRSFEFDTPTGLVVERSKLDNHLVHVGQQHGVTFLSPVTASLGKVVGEHRIVRLRGESTNRDFSSRVVVLATGLGRQRGEADVFQQVAHPRSRVGVEAIIGCSGGVMDENTIYMSIGKDGYVGLTKLGHDKMHVAAAVDRLSLRESGPQATVRQILQETGHVIEIAEHTTWRGTPALTTRARQFASTRVFLVGDAANYVEPFTGEGILWALKSGIGVAPFLEKAVGQWHDSLTTQWEDWHKNEIQTNQRTCRQIAFGLKHASLRWVARQALRFQPGIARSVIRRLNGQS